MGRLKFTCDLAFDSYGTRSILKYYLQILQQRQRIRRSSSGQQESRRSNLNLNHGDRNDEDDNNINHNDDSYDDNDDNDGDHSLGERGERRRSTRNNRSAVEESITFMDEIEIILAEIRSSRPTVILSTQARREFVENVLITKQVILVSDEPSKEEECSRTSSVDQKCEEDDQKHEVKGDLRILSSSDPFTCTICLVDYNEGDIISWSHNPRCNHYFHRKCILQWLCQDRDDCPCCRNNYLALSDDEEDNEDDENNDEGEDGNVEDAEEQLQQLQIGQLPSELQTRNIEATPSYFTPFTRMSTQEFEQYTHALEENTLRSTALQFGEQATNGDQENESLISVDLESANGGSSLYTQDIEEDDAWSCPGESDVDDQNQTTYEPLRRLRHRRQLRRQMNRSREAQHSWRQDSRNRHQLEEPPSLELGELIVEGLMRRLEERAAEDRSARGTESSSSVYTEGEEEHCNRSIPVAQSCATTTRCAICRKEYRVNEELCWSQDPLCNHVFHRACMLEWIQEHDECPLCSSQDDEMTSPSDDKMEGKGETSVTNEFVGAWSHIFAVPNSVFGDDSSDLSDHAMGDFHGGAHADVLETNYKELGSETSMTLKSSEEDAFDLIMSNLRDIESISSKEQEFSRSEGSVGELSTDQQDKVTPRQSSGSPIAALQLKPADGS